MMLSADTVLFRTDKGDLEIEERACHLDYRSRSILLFVNGRFNIAQIAERFGKEWDMLGMLDKLLLDDFVSTRPDGTPIPRQPKAVNGNSIKARFLSVSEEVLGASNARIVDKIEACEDEEEQLSHLIDSLYLLVKLTISERKAETLKSALSQLLP